MSPLIVPLTSPELNIKFNCHRFILRGCHPICSGFCAGLGESHFPGARRPKVSKTTRSADQLLCWFIGRAWLCRSSKFPVIFARRNERKAHPPQSSLWVLHRVFVWL